MEVKTEEVLTVVLVLPASQVQMAKVLRSYWTQNPCKFRG